MSYECNSINVPVQSRNSEDSHSDVAVHVVQGTFGDIEQASLNVLLTSNSLAKTIYVLPTDFRDRVYLSPG